MQTGDLWLGVLPASFCKLVSQSCTLLLENCNQLTWQQDCPNHKKYPCGMCKLCFNAHLSTTLLDNMCKKIVQNVHHTWVGRCKEPSCRPVRGQFNTPRPGGQNQGPPAPSQRAPKPRRATTCAQREALFSEVVGHVQRHQGCGLCNGQWPRFVQCVCVNDSPNQQIVDTGRALWGGDRCPVCVRRGSHSLPLEQGIT